MASSSDALEHLHHPEALSYLTAAQAAAIDADLMGPAVGYTLEQLMELAGLSVACAVAEVYPPQDRPRVLVVCGPGNNGGDGMVAARHLYHLGYHPQVCYPKRTNKPFYHALVRQLESYRIPVLDRVPAEEEADLAEQFDLVVDAIFGFSFTGGTPRPPFDAILRRLSGESSSRPVVVSVDIPSGWHVEQGDVQGTGLRPDMLVSLTAPKLCARKFTGGHHFLGGRFVPSSVADKYGLKLPPYPGSALCVRIGHPPAVDVASLREDYVGAVLLEEQVRADPVEQFQAWFEDAVAAGLHEPNAMTLATADSAGRPSARMVLLKGFDRSGFVWYTNYTSRKASELAGNPQASLVFFWERLHRQVRVEGAVEKVSREETEAYFHSRPRGSQLGAIVSTQSSVIAGRSTLDQAYDELVAKYADGSVPVPLPDTWGGFRLRPRAVEFWQGRSSRLHDRLRYTLVGEDGSAGWKIERLAP